MITFPKGFVKIYYPGYFWDTINKELYSIKVGGILKKLPCRKPFYGYGNFIPAGYQLSYKGSRKFMPKHRLMMLKDNGKEQSVDFL